MTWAEYKAREIVVGVFHEYGSPQNIPTERLIYVFAQALEGAARLDWPSDEEKFKNCAEEVKKVTGPLYSFKLSEVDWWLMGYDWLKTQIQKKEK